MRERLEGVLSVSQQSLKYRMQLQGLNLASWNKKPAHSSWRDRRKEVLNIQANNYLRANVIFSICFYWPSFDKTMDTRQWLIAFFKLRGDEPFLNQILGLIVLDSHRFFLGPIYFYIGHTWKLDIQRDQAFPRTGQETQPDRLSTEVRWASDYP